MLFVLKALPFVHTSAISCYLAFDLVCMHMPSHSPAVEAVALASGHKRHTIGSLAAIFTTQLVLPGKPAVNVQSSKS